MKKVFIPIKNSIETLVYANLWVALAVVSLCGLTFLHLGKVDYALLWFVFFATLLMYAYARWFEEPTNALQTRSKISVWQKNNHRLYLLSGLFGLFGSMWFALKLTPGTWAWLSICIAISAFYPLQIRAKGRVALRNVAGLKLFLISFVWALVSTILPATQVHEGLNTTVWLLFFQRFFFIVAITIPFDIRDLRVDSPAINTLPFVLGAAKSRYIALGCLLFATVAGIWYYSIDIYTLSEVYGQIFAFVIAGICIYKSSPKKSDLYFSFGVESTSIILFFAVLIFNYFWP